MPHPMLVMCLVAALMGIASCSRSPPPQGEPLAPVGQAQNTASNAASNTTTPKIPLQNTPTDLACLSSGKNYTTMFVQTGDGLDIIRKTDGTWKLKIYHASRSTMW